LNDAETAVAGLPLAQKEMSSFQIIPPRPYGGFGPADCAWLIMPATQGRRTSTRDRRVALVGRRTFGDRFIPGRRHPDRCRSRSWAAPRWGTGSG
jgi:hypothetical protein